MSLLFTVKIQVLLLFTVKVQVLVLFTVKVQVVFLFIVVAVLRACSITYRLKESVFA